MISGARVIDQSRRRVLDGEQVPTAEKLYSIFEPHTDLIKRGKVQTPIEFGHEVFLAESARGLITQYEVLDGNPIDEQHVVILAGTPQTDFRRRPQIVRIGSRLLQREERDVVQAAKASRWSASHSGAASRAPEREAYEKIAGSSSDGQRFRAGIEGRISVLFRGRGMKR